MRSFITGLLFLLSFSCAMAQAPGSEAGKAKLQMVKATAEFLSRDKATFGDVAKHECSGCKTYDDIKKFATDNKLMKVDGLIDELQKMKVDSTIASLTTFKDAIISKITTGAKNREDRLNMPEYKDFIGNLNDDIASIKASSSQDDEAPPVTAQTENTKPSTPVKKPDTNITDAATQTMPGETAPEASLVDKAMPWLPYIIAGVLLVVLIIVYNTSQKHKGAAVLFDKDRKSMAMQIEALRKERDELENRNRKLAEELQNSKSDFDNASKLLKAEKNKQKPKPQTQPADAEPAPVAIEKPLSKISVQKAKPVAAALKYARYADLGDGFSNASLMDAADDETIFELMIVPNSSNGEFRVTSQLAAQHYALSNAQYFLGKTCQYNSFPSENATIQTEANGIIKLNGNKWTIVSPAKISFS